MTHGTSGVGRWKSRGTSTEATEAESLRSFTAALSRFTREYIEPPRDWNDAIAGMFRAVGGRPTMVVLDEFPLAQVAGPDFAAMCRAFALESGHELFGEQPSEVGAGVVNDAANRTKIEVDVVALAPLQPNSPRRVVSLGKVRWGEVMGHHHLDRLARARDLVRAKGYDTDGTVLALYGGAGFTAELTAAAASDDRILLVEPARLFSP